MWQVQEAKQRFSELLRAARAEGPQVVTRHGEAVAVVVDVAEFRRLTGVVVELKDYLHGEPNFDDLDLPRATDMARDIDWSDGS